MGQPMSAGDQLCSDESQKSIQQVLLQTGLAGPGHFLGRKEPGLHRCPDKEMWEMGLCGLHTHARPQIRGRNLMSYRTKTEVGF